MEKVFVVLQKRINVFLEQASVLHEELCKLEKEREFKYQHDLTRNFKKNKIMNGNITKKLILKGLIAWYISINELRATLQDDEHVIFEALEGYIEGVIQEISKLPLADEKSTVEALRLQKMALADKLVVATEYVGKMDKNNPNYDVACTKYLCLLAVCQHVGVGINFEIPERIFRDLF
jgi:hypothetical protein